MNVEFQRIARRDKKAFLRDQCKEIEENNRMGRTRDLFKKIRDTKETFHAKMGSIKDRNGMNLTEAEDIKKRWQEYTEELHKKDLYNQDNHDSVNTHLEPDILECKVQWACPFSILQPLWPCFKSSNMVRGFLHPSLCTQCPSLCQHPRQNHSRQGEESGSQLHCCTS